MMVRGASTKAEHGSFDVDAAASRHDRHIRKQRAVERSIHTFSVAFDKEELPSTAENCLPEILRNVLICLRERDIPMRRSISTPLAGTHCQNACVREGTRQGELVRRYYECTVRSALEQCGQKGHNDTSVQVPLRLIYHYRRSPRYSHYVSRDNRCVALAIGHLSNAIGRSVRVVMSRQYLFIFRILQGNCECSKRQQFIDLVKGRCNRGSKAGRFLHPLAPNVASYIPRERVLFRDQIEQYSRVSLLPVPIPPARPLLPLLLGKFPVQLPAALWGQVDTAGSEPRFTLGGNPPNICPLTGQGQVLDQGRLSRAICAYEKAQLSTIHGQPQMFARRQGNLPSHAVPQRN